MEISEFIQGEREGEAWGGRGREMTIGEKGGKKKLEAPDKEVLP